MRLEGRNKTHLCLLRGMLYIVKGNVLDILERESIGPWITQFMKPWLPSWIKQCQFLRELVTCRFIFLA